MIPWDVGDVSANQEVFFCLGCKAAKIPSKIHPFDVGPVFGMGFPYEQKVIDFD